MRCENSLARSLDSDCHFHTSSLSLTTVLRIMHKDLHGVLRHKPKIHALSDDGGAALAGGSTSAETSARYEAQDSVSIDDA